ncbi:MAG TPA: DUF1501 domain-containing protein [Planctomycetaceae bacterium]|nr:DUF1501 domain-containing protein [Planctomycetaceae bacterium]
MLNRRSVLQSMAAMGLSFSLPTLSARAAEKRSTERPKSLITLWMNGGMSQLETWDPHPGGVQGGDAKAINTSVDGLQICDFLPQMAEQMHNVTLVRSLVSTEGEHARGTAYVKTGYRLEPTLVYPALGAIAACKLPDDGVEIPPHVSLGGNRFFPRGGYLGNEWDAFRVFRPGESLKNLKSGVSDDRQARRLKGLDFLSQRFAQGRPTVNRDTLHAETVKRALAMMTSEQLKAFEVDEEPEAVRKAYGDSRFGRGCVVARRLVEQGVRAVEVVLDGFDTHVNNHNGQKTQADMLDPAFATLIQELKARDLLDSTIVLCISEFGRTPRINPAGGRDHWPHWFPCVVAGGGFQSGLVLGETPAHVEIKQGNGSQKAKYSPTDPISVSSLYATVMHAMGIDYEEEIITPIGRPKRLAEDGADPRMLIESLAKTIPS